MAKQIIYFRKTICPNSGNFFLLFVSVLLLFSVASRAICQKPLSSPIPMPERPRALVALLNDARIAAPELGVDTFLKIAESKKITDPVWRKEIIQEAIRMKDDLNNPVRKS